MYEIFLFLVVIYAVRVIGFSATQVLMPKFLDKGYAFAGTLGLIFVSYIAWILSYIFGFHITQNSLWIIVLVLIALCGFLYYRKPHLWRARLSETALLLNILKSEVLFFVAFFAMLAVRSFIPSINNVEDIMDIALINGLTRTEVMPPQDVWFSGHTINYYYFGHFIVAVVAKLSSISNAILYNIFVAYTFATAATGMFSIVHHLTKKAWVGIFSSLLLVVGGNLSFLNHILFKNEVAYFYADARSLIERTINEFPAYSFIIGNLHAHIISVPFVLLAIGLCIVCIEFKENKISIPFYINLSLVLGTLFIINSWDFVIYCGLFALIHFIKGYNNPRSLLLLFVIPATSILFIFRYLHDFTNPTSGIGLVRDPTPITAIIIMFGYFLLLSIVGIINYKKQNNKMAFNILLLSALTLMIVPMVFYVKDIYDSLNPPFYRANTFFKFWYQSWILFVIISGVSLSTLVDSIRTKFRYKMNLSLLIIVISLSIFIFTYPVISYKYILNNRKFVGLDGYKYLDDTNPGKKKTIDWLNQEIEGQPVILEAHGKSYSNFSTVSAYTGLPTVAGWYEHELGWRNDWPYIASRMGDIEKMYTSASHLEVQDLLNRYEIEYVVVGRNERELFGANAGEMIKTLASVQLSDNGEELYWIIK